MKSSKLCKAMKHRIELYLDQARKVHLDSSADMIHDFRVASRYLLAIEPLLRCASDTKKWRKKVKHGLKSLTRLRDLHVFRTRFCDKPELIAILDKATEKELHNTTALRRHAGHNSYAKKLRASFRTLCSSKHNKSTIDALIYELWKKRWVKLTKSLQAVDYEDPASIHRLRISFKPFRYLASFLHESGLVPVSSFDEFKYWQDIMGDINDLDVASSWLQEITGHEALVAELAINASLLRQKMKSEHPAFSRFTAKINADVLAKLGLDPVVKA